tara:strand:- start:1629 stop:2363 length:735 start_codon:yes stop_codon:yes gene_type:complete
MKKYFLGTVFLAVFSVFGFYACNDIENPEIIDHYSVIPPAGGYDYYSQVHNDCGSYHNKEVINVLDATSDSYSEDPGWSNVIFNAMDSMYGINSSDMLGSLVSRDTTQDLNSFLITEFGSSTSSDLTDALTVVYDELSAESDESNFKTIFTSWKLNPPSGLLPGEVNAFKNAMIIGESSCDYWIGPNDNSVSLRGWWRSRHPKAKKSDKYQNIVWGDIVMSIFATPLGGIGTSIVIGIQIHTGG